MILLLDGYNVINVGNISPARELHERRRELIRRAAEYSLRKKGIQLLIFFDSKEEGFLNEPANSFVRVIFTKTGSADDAMVDWIKRHRTPAEIQMVTDDNELRERAKTEGASFISVSELMKRFDFNHSGKPTAMPHGRGNREKPREETLTLSPKAVSEINRTLPAHWLK